MWRCFFFNHMDNWLKVPHCIFRGLARSEICTYKFSCTRPAANKHDKYFILLSRLLLLNIRCFNVRQQYYMYLYFNLSIRRNKTCTLSLSCHQTIVLLLLPSFRAKLHIAILIRCLIYIPSNSPVHRTVGYRFHISSLVFINLTQEMCRCKWIVFCWTGHQ